MKHRNSSPVSSGMWKAEDTLCYNQTLSQLTQPLCKGTLHTLHRCSSCWYERGLWGDQHRGSRAHELPPQIFSSHRVACTCQGPCPHNTPHVYRAKAAECVYAIMPKWELPGPGSDLVRKGNLKNPAGLGLSCWASSVVSYWTGRRRSPGHQVSLSLDGESILSANLPWNILFNSTTLKVLT